MDGFFSQKIVIQVVKFYLIFFKFLGFVFFGGYFVFFIDSDIYFGVNELVIDIVKYVEKIIN